MAGATLDAQALAGIMNYVKSNLIDDLVFTGNGPTVTFPLTSASFNGPTSGVLSLGAPVTSGAATGGGGSLTACEMAGYFTGSVGGSGSTIVMVPNTIADGQTVNLTSLTISLSPNA